MGDKGKDGGHGLSARWLGLVWCDCPQRHYLACVQFRKIETKIIKWNVSFSWGEKENQKISTNTNFLLPALSCIPHGFVIYLTRQGQNVQLCISPHLVLSDQQFRSPLFGQFFHRRCGFYEDITIQACWQSWTPVLFIISNPKLPERYLGS